VKSVFSEKWDSTQKVWYKKLNNLNDKNFKNKKVKRKNKCFLTLGGPCPHEICQSILIITYSERKNFKKHFVNEKNVIL
jgi:hypothetical protein